MKSQHMPGRRRFGTTRAQSLVPANPACPLLLPPHHLEDRERVLDQEPRLGKTSLVVLLVHTKLDVFYELIVRKKTDCVLIVRKF